VSRPYVRFLIVSEERTGSTFLEMLLNSHEQIICRGEILNPSEEIRRTAMPLSLSVLGAEDDASEYLDGSLYGQVPDHVRAVGFRLMYSHARTGGWENARRRIVDDREIRVIHLTREDLLARYLSYRLALRDGRWIATDEAPQPVSDTIHLDVEDCVKSFVESEVNQEAADREFSSHPMYDLTYEKLTTDFEAESRRVLEFLGVEYRPLFSPTRRQQTRSKREVIENFDELRQFLDQGDWSKSKWQRFADDE
jgi:LPS sulfotransferase NodH